MVVECFFRIQITTWAITKLFYNWFKKKCIFVVRRPVGQQITNQICFKVLVMICLNNNYLLKKNPNIWSFKIWTFSYIIIQSSSFKEVNKDYKWLRPPSSLKSKSFFFFRSYNVCTLFINIFNVKEKKENFRQRSDSKQYVQLIHIGNMFSYR